MYEGKDSEGTRRYFGWSGLRFGRGLLEPRLLPSMAVGKDRVRMREKIDEREIRVSLFEGASCTVQNYLKNIQILECSDQVGTSQMQANYVTFTPCHPQPDGPPAFYSISALRFVSYRDST